MDIRIFKEDVLEGLQKASSILQNKSGAPYLRSVWLKAQENRINIMATDLNMEFKGSYPCEVLKPGLVGVQGKDFVELIRRAYPGLPSIAVDGIFGPQTQAAVIAFQNMFGLVADGADVKIGLYQ